MRLIHYLLFLFVLITSSSVAYSNYDEVADSLKNQLKTTDSKRDKADILLALSSHYNRTYPDTSLIYANQAYNVSTDLKNDTLIANSLNQLGNIYNNKGSHDIALGFFHKALDHAEKVDDQNKIARINNNIGIVYYHQQM